MDWFWSTSAFVKVAVQVWNKGYFSLKERNLESKFAFWQFCALSQWYPVTCKYSSPLKRLVRVVLSHSWETYPRNPCICSALINSHLDQFGICCKLKCTGRLCPSIFVYIGKVEDGEKWRGVWKTILFLFVIGIQRSPSCKGWGEGVFIFDNSFFLCSLCLGTAESVPSPGTKEWVKDSVKCDREFSACVLNRKLSPYYMNIVEFKKLEKITAWIDSHWKLWRWNKTEIVFFCVCFHW